PRSTDERAAQAFTWLKPELIDSSSRVPHALDGPAWSAVRLLIQRISRPPGPSRNRNHDSNVSRGNLMKYRRMAAGLVCLISLLGMAWAQSPDALGKLTSLIRVIANPQAYDGRRIRVIGYLDYNGLDRAVGLYVTELDGRNFVIANSIDLEID